MSELKVNKISPRSGTTVTIGDSGDTTNIVGTLNNNGATLLSLANGVDNRVITSSSANALNGEANLTFDGSTLGVNGAAIFNESGADKDFRVESDGNANMLLVDGGTNRVGIGTTVAIATLNVLADSGSQGIDVLGRSSDNRSRIQLSSNNGTTTYSQWDYNGTTVELKAVANVPLVFRTNNTERVRIHTNGVMSAVNGIALGVGTASTASNVLDDYEEGTFSPTFTSSSASFSYSFQYGFYTKIGRSVTCNIWIRGQSSGTTSNALKVANLPFTSISATGYFASTSFGQIYLVDYPSNAKEILGHVGSNATIIDLQYSTDDAGAVNLPASAVDGSTASGFMITLTYITA